MVVSSGTIAFLGYLGYEAHSSSYSTSASDDDEAEAEAERQYSASIRSTRTAAAARGRGRRWVIVELYDCRRSTFCVVHVMSFVLLIAIFLKIDANTQFKLLENSIDGYIHICVDFTNNSIESRGI